MNFYSIVTLCIISIIALNADPIPHTDHSKLYILSRLAFNYLDLSGDSRLSEGEMDAMRYFPVNGVALKSVEDVKRMRESMDQNKNGFIDEQEFIQFEHWLPIFINGRPGGSIKNRDLLTYASSRQDQPAYIQLDRNRDGQLDNKELKFAS